MPNCYCLTRKDFMGPRPEPEKLVTVDERICHHFGVKPHEKYWFRDWENVIGLRLALGWSWDRIREDLNNCRSKAVPDDVIDDLIKIASWLEQHYDTDAWAEIGRR
jgi:hypothetical protein